MQRLINPTRVVAVLVWALLWTPLLDGAFNSALGGPVTASATANASNESLISPPPSTPPAAAPKPRAYLFRGAMGPIFSLGIDRLTQRLEDAGITANVYEFTICRFIADKAIEEYRANPAPIVLIGHSMGGYCSIKFAEMLQAEGIRVDLIVAIDPAHVTPDVPLNVDRFINIFLSKDVLGGGDVKPMPGYKGHYASFDMALRDELSHVTIEKSDTIQQQLVTKVLQLTTAKAEGDTVPVRFVVPPKAPIELWDDGMPVFARPGDTLQSIATAYHVPLWSITQINKGADRAPLVPGERIIVPRHIEPLVQTSEPALPKH